MEGSVFFAHKKTHTRFPSPTHTGPKDTPYEGGYFVVDIELGEWWVWVVRVVFATTLFLSNQRPPSLPTPDDQYPFVPPKMKFATKVWHPNISSASGAICLDILKDAWSPALTLKTALLSLQALLASPEPGDPQDAVVARQYLSDNAAWAATAKAWTATHATREAAAGGRGSPAHSKLIDMGFEEGAAAAALAAAGGDEAAALERLLGG